MSSKKKAPERPLETRQELIDYLGIGGVDASGQLKWDAIIVGDGSGQACDSAFGAAAVLIDAYSNKRKHFSFAGNVGTVSIAELVPYICALVWYTAPDGPGRARHKAHLQARRNMRVHIVTDSKYVATMGNETDPTRRKAYPELWGVIDSYRANGYEITYHHIPRNMVNLNMLVDQMARRARLDIEGTFARAMADLREMYPGLPEGLTIYDFSP